MNEPTAHPDQLLLLLYLSNEMSLNERRALENRLAGDTALRRQLEALQETEAAVNQGLSALDASDAIDNRARAAERQVARALAQWQVDRLARPAAADTRTKIRRVPVWLYPLSAAAVVMVCLGLWYLSFDRNDDGSLADGFEPPTNMELTIPDDEEPTPDLELAVTDGGSFGELEEEMAKLITLSRAMQ
jgi:hypothetical protein